MTRLYAHMALPLTNSRSSRWAAYMYWQSLASETSAATIAEPPGWITRTDNRRRSSASSARVGSCADVRVAEEDTEGARPGRIAPVLNVTRCVQIGSDARLMAARRTRAETRG
jgi:hypothetical protein